MIGRISRRMDSDQEDFSKRPRACPSNDIERHAPEQHRTTTQQANKPNPHRQHLSPKIQIQI
ncbi:hypothetical protein BT69DRAFT_1282998, partial [Atractiella rhizophila]